MTQTAELDLPEGFQVKSLPLSAVDIPEGFQVKQPTAPIADAWGDVDLAPETPRTPRDPEGVPLQTPPHIESLRSKGGTAYWDALSDWERDQRAAAKIAKQTGLPLDVTQHSEVIEAHRKDKALYQGITAVGRHPSAGPSEAIKIVKSDAGEAVDAMLNMLDTEEKAGFVGQQARALAS